MAKITVNRDKCKGCLLCVGVCPNVLLEPDEKLNRRGIKPVKFNDNSQCRACAMCAIICPDCCIEVYK